LGPAYAVQTLWIFAIIVPVAAMNGPRFERVSLVATVKSEAFAAFVGARFCVGMVFSTVQLLP
jgi:hypothetical protein